MAIPSIASGTIVGGRWQVIELIGEGGFGQVFKAVDTSSIKLGEAAVKVLHTNTSPLERNVFTSEVQRMATLRHQNLIGYLDSGQIETGNQTHSYLVAELCIESLSHFAHKQPDSRLATIDVLHVLDDIASGLGYLHNKKMVHRDIKPANVMYGDSAWKLGDFGLTRDLSATGSYHRGDSLRGTPLYMAPELFSTMTATAASDIYAVGVLAHACASNTALHQGSGQALIQNIISTPPRIDPSLSPALQNIIYCCTAAEPQNRPTASQLRDLITQHKSAPLSATPIKPPPAAETNPTQVASWPEKKSNKPKIVMAAAAFCFLIASVTATILSMRPEPEEKATKQQEDTDDTDKEEVAAPQVSGTTKLSTSVTSSTVDSFVDIFKRPAISVPAGNQPGDLTVIDDVTGGGLEAVSGSQVTVDYVGASWSTGEEFDASWNRGEQFSFVLGTGVVISGWDQGIIGMKVGGRRTLIIPPDLAYGAEGIGEIGPNETLIFTVDLRSVG